MTAKRKRRAPDGLKARGRRFWDHVKATYELSDAEWEVLPEACRTLDIVEDLDRRARRSEDTAERLTLYREARLQRQGLHRLLAALNLPDEEGESLPSPKTARARKAADARWAKVRALREGDDGAS